MSQFEPGDLVVLSCGSMRMAVESVDGDTVNTVWCHEGTIGRDSFAAVLLRKWEVREDSPRDSGDRPSRPSRPKTAPRGERSDRGDRDEKPRGKPGWDGKPREKKFFRKD